MRRFVASVLLVSIGALVLPLFGLAAFTAALPQILGLGFRSGAAGQPPGSPRDPLAAIPVPMLSLYAEAAATCPGLAWTILAAIGTIESDNGLSTAPGVHSGANAAGAEGPMQFEPGTFAAVSVVGPGGASPPSPYNASDAVFSAVHLLCLDGAGQPATLTAAIYDYNHSAQYVRAVINLAAIDARAAAERGARSSGRAALAYAAAQIGTPYVFGAERPGRGFDCSGLAQAAYAAAGVAIPRGAQAQFDAGPLVPAGMPLLAGDLVFFGRSASEVLHVGVFAGIVAGRPLMLDAPSTGADVRVDQFPTTVGAPFGDETFVGATRPAN